MKNKNYNKILVVFLSIVGIGFSLSAKADLAPGNITTCGVLSTVGAIYTLQNDVSSDGTCFTIKGDNISLDLNGYTVTYDNQAPIIIPNSSFENADMSDWDFTNAPNASRALGTFVGSTVSTYDGDYAVGFALPAADQYIQSANDVTLEANTSYSLSAMFRNAGNNESSQNASGATRDPITMTVSIDGTAYSATSTGVTWRGFQLTNVVFTTGASPVSGKIRISIANAVAAGVKGYVYVDDIRLLKAKSYGVDIGPNWFGSQGFTITGPQTPVAPLPTTPGDPHRSAIIQGQGNGFENFAVYMEQTWMGDNINNLTITTQGPNSKAIAGQGAIGSSFHDLIINHNVKTIKSRDHYDGAAIHMAAGASTNIYNSQFYNIKIPTCIQTGLYIGQASGQLPNQIHDNDVTVQSRYTNDFAISAGGHVYNNVVNCGTVGNGCRGITGSGNGTELDHNTVTIKDLGISQEYNGCEGSPNGGVYGIQVEDDTSLNAVNNVKIHDNTIIAIATDKCAANALRLNTDNVIADNSYSAEIYNNNFVAFKTGAPHAYAMRNGGFYSQANLLIHDNIFTTNSSWIFHDYSNYPTGEEMTLTNNKFETATAIDSLKYSLIYPLDYLASNPLETPWRPLWFSEYQAGPTTYTFIDNIYGAGDKTLLESACWVGIYNGGACLSTTLYGKSVFQQTQKTYAIADFATMISNWLSQATSNVSDINKDVIVNSLDLGIAMSKWN